MDAATVLNILKENIRTRVLFALVFAFVAIFLERIFFPENNLKNYLPLHAFMETFSIIIAGLIFAVTWVDTKRPKNMNIVVLAAIFLAVAIIDFVHILFFPGMPGIISDASTDTAIYFWLSGRMLVALGSLYLAFSNPELLSSSTKKYVLLFSAVFVTLLICWIGIFHIEMVPRTYIEGQGLTPFKIYSEGIITATLALSAITLILRSSTLSRYYNIENILVAIGMTIISELFFTLYSIAEDIHNFSGHIFKVIAYYFFYRALFRESILKPYEELDEKNKLLERAKIASEAVCLAKSQFLTNMSHEIRTPMNSILGMADMLGETSLNEQQSHYLKSLKDAGGHLLNLINDILDLSRIEAGYLDLHVDEFELKSVLNQIERIFLISAKKKGLDLRFKIPEDIPKYVAGDLNKFNRVLFNIIGNAIKFTDQGFIEVELNVKNRTIDDIEIQVRVTDTGIGIPSDKTKDLFKYFSQVNSTNPKNHNGTGLGLAISKKLVEVMKGKIWMESELNKGSSFYFTTVFKLPQAKVIQMKKTADATSRLSGLSSQTPFNILSVEDSEDNQQLIEIYLNNSPYKVERAENGKIALEKYIKNKYFLILMDMQMPVMNGYDAVKEIRKYEKENNLQPVPIIAITANAFREDEEHCLSVGCTSYLSKPMRKIDLIEAISKILQKTSSSAEQKSTEPSLQDASI